MHHTKINKNKLKDENKKQTSVKNIRTSNSIKNSNTNCYITDEAIDIILIKRLLRNS